MKNTREEGDILDRLIQWASQQGRVRAMLLTSSRANEHAPVDFFSDYDVLMYVADCGPFVADEGWLGEFGQVLVQFRDQRESGGVQEYARLVRYEDGIKIDFTIAPLEAVRRIREEPRLPAYLDVGYRVLVDKDHLTDGLRPSSFTAYILGRPTAGEFGRVVEEFWWETTEVAKNLWRDELLLAKYNLEYVIKLDLLRRMLEWYVGIGHAWRWKAGRLGRGLKKTLPPEIWAELEGTFAAAGIEDNWRAVFNTTVFFRKIASAVAAKLGYHYPHELDDRVTRHLWKVRESKGGG